MIKRLTCILVLATGIFATIIQVPGDSETIQGGIDLAAHGDTVLVAPGEYVENINFDEKNIVLTSYLILDQDTSHISGTVIDGSANDQSVVWIGGGRDTTRVLNGFTLTGGSGTFVSSWGSYVGGGLVVVGGAKITNNRIVSNHMQSTSVNLEGGGILIYTLNYLSEQNGRVILDNNLIAYNTMSGVNDVNGGGISIQGRGTTKVTRNTIVHNAISGESVIVGGGICLLGGVDQVISDNDISSNSVEATTLFDLVSGGGGLAIVDTTVVLRKNLICGNNAPMGGGILGYGGANGFNMRLLNNTIADNAASYQGGAFFFTNGHCTGVNNIVWGNTAPEDAETYLRGTVDFSYSILQDGHHGDGNLFADPLFEDGSYVLSAGSPAIDAGNPDSGYNDLADPANPTQPLWPALGTLQADLGAFGGNETVPVALTPYSGRAKFLWASHGAMQYRYALPTDYDSSQTYPLTLVLHGYGQWGSNNRSQLFEGLSWRVNAEHYGRNEFTLCPQAPTAGWYVTNNTTASAILRNMIDTYPIDTTQIVVTGWSNGGGGCWGMINLNPESFSAAIPIAPISGTYDETEFTPAWIFHGAEDDVVNVGISQARADWYEYMGVPTVYTADSSDAQVMAAIESGAKAIYSEFEGAGHRILKYSYDNPPLFDWLERQRRPLIRPRDWHLEYVGLDSVQVTTRFKNPQDLSFEPTLTIQKYAQFDLTNHALFDDGEHGDSLALDGIWGKRVAIPEAISHYRVGIGVNNTETDDYFHFQDLIPITNHGPLVFEAHEQLHPEGGAIPPNTAVFFNLTIRNMNSTVPFEDAWVYLEVADTNARISPGYRGAYLGTIQAGGSAETHSYVALITSADCEEGTPIYYNILIGTQDDVFWRETSVLLGHVGLEEADVGLPDQFALHQNYPNPFNPFTTIEYALPERSKVQMTVFDVMGREVIRLDEGDKPAGYHRVLWDAADSAGKLVDTGVYFCRIQAGSFTETIKMVYLR